MGNREAMRDMFFALFGLLVLLQAWFGAWGVVRLSQLRAGLPLSGSVGWLLGFRDLPSWPMNGALGHASVIWRRAIAWSDVCAGTVGALSALLAIPVAIALPISSSYSTAVDRGIVLVAVAFALSGAGSALGRCAAITWVTPPAAARNRPPLSRARRRVTAQAIAVWAVDAVVTLLLAVAIVVSVQTPPAGDYIVPAYVAMVLSFPILLAVALAGEMWLGGQWRSLVRSVLDASPNLPVTTEYDFRSFAGTLMTGRTMMVGLFVGVGQFFFTMWIASYEPYFGMLADVAALWAVIALPTVLLT